MSLTTGDYEADRRARGPGRSGGGVVAGSAARYSFLIQARNRSGE